LLLREAPVPDRGTGTIAADACGFIARRGLKSRIATGGDGIVGLIHTTDVRPHDAVSAEVERLLREPLVFLLAVGGNSNYRSYGGSYRTGIGYRSATQ